MDPAWLLNASYPGPAILSAYWRWDRRWPRRWEPEWRPPPQTPQWIGSAIGVLHSVGSRLRPRAPVGHHFSVPGHRSGGVADWRGLVGATKGDVTSSTAFEVWCAVSGYFELVRAAATPWSLGPVGGVVVEDQDQVD